jgi:hypothetical protein
MAESQEALVNSQSSFVVTEHYTPSYTEVRYQDQYSCLGGGLAGPICKMRPVKNEYKYPSRQSFEVKIADENFDVSEIKK